MKHIESIQPEYAAEELERIGREETDATASAALTALLHNVTGCAIPPTADTPQSEVEELVPLCLSILRRHWTTPLTALGDGNTPMSLADLMRRLIGDRVQGNEAWSIPPANADIPTAVAALLDRDMSSGLTLTLPAGEGSPDGSPTSLPDGLSLAQLLCGVSPDGSDLVSSVTELHDSNKGWYWDCTTNNFLFKIFTQVRFASIGCGEVYTSANNIIENNTYMEEMHFPHLKTISVIGNKGRDWGILHNLANLKRVEFASLEKYYANYHSSSYEGIVAQCESLEEVIAPSLSHIEYPYPEGSNAIFSLCPNLKKIVLGKLTFVSNITRTSPSISDSFLNTECPNLIHFEIGEGSQCNIKLTAWNPTTALAERLPEFLSNFNTYIANRLTDKGGGLTLTLSQAVRDAIQQDPEIVSIITSKGWTISPAPSV